MTTFNAYCRDCDAIATGTLGALLDAGWQGDLTMCVQHRSYDTPPYVAPAAMRLVVDEFPAWVSDRGHWGPDEWQPRTVGGYGQLELAA